MPTTLVEPIETIVDPSIGPQRKKWTRDEVAALAASGIVNVERLELIDGDLFDKMGRNRPHVNALHGMAALLRLVFGDDRVTQESAIGVAAKDWPTSDPEPDIVVTSRGYRSFQTAPAPQDILLVVEVSDTTLRYDLSTKAALYARAGIAEYWVVDVNRKALIVHRQPQQGQYLSRVSYDVRESVTPLAAPNSSVAVASVF